MASAGRRAIGDLSGMSTQSPRWVQLAEAALDLVVPQECAGCAHPGRVWCRRCASACATGPAPVSDAMGVWAACEHAGPAGRAVVAFKDAGVRRMAGPLAELLAGAVSAALDDVRTPRGAPVWLVPVPSRRNAVRTRGSDHMSVLAGRAARELRQSGVPANRCPGLVHSRATTDQVGLSRNQRIANVRGSLWALELPPGVVVIVDDVTTTGATIGEAIRAMALAGRQVACAATVTSSQGPRRRASGTHWD